MSSSNKTWSSVISRRYVEVRKLQRYLDLIWGPNNYTVTVLNDKYSIEGPQELTADQQEEIHDLTRTLRRYENRKIETPTGPQALPQGQDAAHGKQAAGALEHKGTTTASTGGQGQSSAAGTPAERQEIEGPGPISNPQRTGTKQSDKDRVGLLGRLKRTLTGKGLGK